MILLSIFTVRTIFYNVMGSLKIYVAQLHVLTDAFSIKQLRNVMIVTCRVIHFLLNVLLDVLSCLPIIFKSVQTISTREKLFRGNSLKYLSYDVLNIIETICNFGAYIETVESLMVRL